MTEARMTNDEYGGRVVDGSAHAEPVAPWRVIAGQRAQITYPDANSDPPTITLQPGEVVEFTAE
jgi:hypothetical protein